MKMKKNIKVLALGGVLALSLIVPSFANEEIETVRSGKLRSNIENKFSTQKPMLQRNIDSEQMKEMFEKSLENLEKAYEEGKIDEERYEAAKERIEENLEKIENGDYSFMQRGASLRSTDPEEMKTKLEERLESLEKEYEEGKIDEERYEVVKAKIEENLEKIENGDYSFMQSTVSLRSMDPEEMKTKLEERLESLEKEYEEGKIDEEKYEAAKAKLEENLEKIENGDYSFMQRAVSLRSMDPEEMKTKLEERLESLETEYEEGEIDGERYEAIKAKIEETLEKIDK